MSAEASLLRESHSTSGSKMHVKQGHQLGKEQYTEQCCNLQLYISALSMTALSLALLSSFLVNASQLLAKQCQARSTAVSAKAGWADATSTTSLDNNCSG